MAPQTADVSSGASEEEKNQGVTLTSGFLKYPVGRDQYLKNSDLWMEGKREDDAVAPFWRVHDKLYDLTNFVQRHPGGQLWIEETQGTDITEAFESSHFGSGPEEILKKYFVKEISSKRNSPFTFQEKGFYKTLKKKVTPILKAVGRGPTTSMLLIQDSLLFGFLCFALISALRNCYWSAAAAGFFLALAGTSAHNFFHQKDNWRMHIFDLLLLSSREWRLSHALSHHLFPNTIYDFEITMFEPHLNFLAKPKDRSERYLVHLSVFIMCFVSFYVGLFKKMMLLYMGKIKLRLWDSVPLIELLLMAIFRGSLSQGLWLWLIMHTTCAVFFAGIGLTAAHHHPEIYREGDAPAPSKDWGLHQVSATRERGELFVSSLLLAAVSFGNHTLHHLFPTVDHSKLHHLQPAFLETCKEFGVKFEMFTPMKMVKGFFNTLTATEPNKNPPKCFKAY